MRSQSRHSVRTARTPYYPNTHRTLRLLRAIFRVGDLGPVVEIYPPDGLGGGVRHCAREDRRARDAAPSDVRRVAETTSWPSGRSIEPLELGPGRRIHRAAP